MLSVLLALTVPVTACAILYARREYRKRGKLTLLGVSMLCIMLLLPNLVLEYATRYKLPDSPLEYIGVIIALAGVVLCMAGVMAFGSFSKMMCMDAGQLTVTGPYRWSRNPQYVGYWLFLLGFSLTDWSAWCFAVLLVVAISLHLLVLVEERHLRRVFNEPYMAFCKAIPRYAGFRGLRF